MAILYSATTLKCHITDYNASYLATLYSHQVNQPITIILDIKQAAVKRLYVLYPQAEF